MGEKKKKNEKKDKEKEEEEEEEKATVRSAPDGSDNNTITRSYYRFWTPLEILQNSICNG